jgi:protoporphyrinogen oxidase
MAERKIRINRAPVLTLWAAVVAERLGFYTDETLSLGKAVAGLNAQSKGRRLGIFKPAPREIREARKRKHGEEFRVELLGRPVPAVSTADGVRAVTGAKVIEPDGVKRYLESKFGDDFAAARSAMITLARRFKPEQLQREGFRLYEQFRPEIPDGVRGWGVKGELDLARMRKLTANAD